MEDLLESTPTSGRRPRNGDRQPTESPVTESVRDAARAVRRAKEHLAGAYDRTSEMATRAYRGAQHGVQQNPGLTALVALGAGVGVGLMLAGARRSRSFRSRALPVLVTAITDAVHEIVNGR